MSNDRISNMLSSITNASKVGKATIELPYTKETEQVAKVLKKAKFITEVRKFKEKGSAKSFLGIDIAYDESGEPVVTTTKRISKPGRRLYLKYDQIKRVAGGYGVSVVSTSKGIMAGYEARKQKVGGEILCEVE